MFSIYWEYGQKTRSLHTKTSTRTAILCACYPECLRPGTSLPACCCCISLPPPSFMPAAKWRLATTWLQLIYATIKKLSGSSIKTWTELMRPYPPWYIRNNFLSSGRRLNIEWMSTPTPYTAAMWYLCAQLTFSSPHQHSSSSSLSCGPELVLCWS